MARSVYDLRVVDKLKALNATAVHVDDSLLKEVDHHPALKDQVAAQDEEAVTAEVARLERMKDAEALRSQVQAKQAIVQREIEATEETLEVKEAVLEEKVECLKKKKAEHQELEKKKDKCLKAGKLDEADDIQEDIEKVEAEEAQAENEVEEAEAEVQETKQKLWRMQCRLQLLAWIGLALLGYSNSRKRPEESSLLALPSEKVQAKARALDEAIKSGASERVKIYFEGLMNLDLAAMA